jgi:cytochrome c peroxidase
LIFAIFLRYFKEDKMTSQTFKKLLFVSISVIAISCNSTKDVVEANTTDLALENTLKGSSGGIGKAFYEMPSSDNYLKIPQDPLNSLNASKVELGKLLFHETGLAQNPKESIGMNTYSCASCHHAKAGFQACMPQGIGEGGTGFGVNGESRKQNTKYLTKDIDTQPIRTPSAMNMAYQTNILWNGQFGGTHLNIGTESSWTAGTPKAVNKMGFEGIETQAIAGRDVHRLVIDKIFMSNFSKYKELYLKSYDLASFNNPNELKKNGALAIAAYERTLLSNQAPFQMWLKGSNGAMTEDEKQGALLFFGKANCVKCHNGPALANMEFHALGMNDLTTGSYGGKEVVNVNETNPEHKGRGGFTNKEADMFKFKVPQLYNLKDSPFYGHGASFTSIKAILDYKNDGLKENGKVPSDKLSPDFKPLGLSTLEIEQLTLFIKDALYDPNLERYTPQSLPSGLAFPNNDNQTRIDLGF